MTLKIQPKQSDFIFSQALHTGLIGGYGSGKTYAGIAKTAIKKLQNPGISVAYYLPTYPLIRDIAFPYFQKFFADAKIPCTINKTDKDVITPYGKIILRSMDNADLIIGYEVGYSLIDEADVLPTDKMRDIFVKVLGRNRSKLADGAPNSLDFVSTPEGHKFLYEFFVTKADQDKRLIRIRTDENRFVPQSYIDSLYKNYSPQQLKAYMNGEFVNLTSGTVYYNYDVNKNRTERGVAAGETLHVGIDFNIQQMAAVVHVKDGKHIYAVDEITKAFDTYEVVSLLKSRYPKHRLFFYPDASGKQRSTSGTSDFAILKQAFGQNCIISGPANPPVRDRVNAVNTAFKDGQGQAKYFVNRDKCFAYSNALEQQVYNKYGEPDKSEGHDHVIDAAGYAIYKLTETKSFRMYV